MQRLVTIVAVLTVITFVAGCASTPASRFYTLSAASGPAAPSSNLSIAVGPVTVPAVVDRPQIVVSMGPNQVRLEEFNRWAAPLQNTIARVVADNLVLMVGTPRVFSAVQTSSVDADYRAVIDVQSFQSAPGEAAILDAVWTVRRTKDGKVETGRTTVRETVQETSYDALAAGHSRAIARLSSDIANAVRSLERSGP
ncbi:MAG TPA: PqiC family protein [Candidatus Binatia bacterium]|nr:PqiC family protein [Candidatus Binatia bacterium]